MTDSKQNDGGGGPAGFQLSGQGGEGAGLTIHIKGDWDIRSGPPSFQEAIRQMESYKQLKAVRFDASQAGSWDSSLASFVFSVTNILRQRSVEVESSGLPEGLTRMISLASGSGARALEEPATPTAADSIQTAAGKWAAANFQGFWEFTEFLGEATLALFKAAGGKAKYKTSELLWLIQETGAHALPIVTLISVLIGMITAFLGAVQLRLFGAQIFVANIVGLGMTREMAALMTGIILAGRTGASYAAALGTMKVNEEISALKVMGVSPIEYLALPRIAALSLMTPLLTIYSTLLGVMGGAVVAVSLLDISLTPYINHTTASIEVEDVVIGLGKSFLYGLIVALSGIHRGLQCQMSASGVGDATRSAVVTGIVAIIVFDSLINFALSVCGI